MQKLTKDIIIVGAPHPDRKTFDELIPLPNGTSYNSYLIIDEKIALIDTVDPSKTNVLLENLKKSEISHIDYIISNHAEQDHSGSLPTILQQFPKAKVITNQKCKDMLQDLLPIEDEKFQLIQDQETLSLGKHKLQFHITPWVHWPETMCTLILPEKILFTCDLFGSHLSDNLPRTTTQKVIDASKLYYAQIMMTYKSFVKKNVEKIKQLEPNVIAPSHGPIHINPQIIIKHYEEWTNHPKNKALILYISMHGSTKKIAVYLKENLSQKAVPTKLLDLATTPLNTLSTELVDPATIILATPTVVAGPHPHALLAAYLMKIFLPKAPNLILINSYGWSASTSLLAQILPRHPISTLEIKGNPKKSDLKQINQLAEKIVQLHKNLNQP